MYHLHDFIQMVALIIVLNPFSIILIANHLIHRTNKIVSEIIARNQDLFGNKISIPAVDVTPMELVEKSGNIRPFRIHVSQETEQKVLEYSLMFPARGQTRVANELKREGFQVSKAGVRRIWLRHNLQSARLRKQEMLRRIHSALAS